jgi:hypothetical protein
MGTNPMAKAKAEPTPRQKGCGCLTLLVVVAVIAVIVATAGSTSNGPKLPAHVASSQIGQWVTALMGAPSDGIPRVESVQCSASECSIQVHVSAKDVSGSLTEKQLAYPAFRVVFRDPGIMVASVTLYGPIVDQNGNTSSTDGYNGIVTCGVQAPENHVQQSWTTSACRPVTARSTG